MSSRVQEFYHWTKTSGGTFSRPIGFVETYLVRASELSQPHDEKCIYASASFQFCNGKNTALIEEAGRQAWTAMRYYHPSIACTVNIPEKKFEYRSPVSEKDIESWLSSTFIITNSEFSSIIRQAKKLPLATLYFNPESQSMLLQTSHWRFDARGVLLFFDAFFDALAKPNPQPIIFGDEHARLSPPLDALVGFPDPSPAEAAAEIDAVVDRFVNAQPALGLDESVNVENQWLGSDAVRITFSPDESAAVIRGAKNKNITISQAIQAATVLTTAALANNQSQDKTKETPSLTILDLRPWCAEHATNTPVASYFGGILTVIGPGGFDDATRQLGEQWKKWVRTDLFKDGFAQYRERFLPITSQPMPFLPSTPFVTSLGIADNYLKREHGDGDGKVTVTDYCIADERVGRELVVFAWTFNDKLELNLAYNYGYLERGFVKKFGEILKMQLYQGLDLTAD